MAGHSRPKDGVASARLRPAIPLSSKELSPVMDTRVKPAYDESRLLFLGEFRRRFAGNLPEGVGKSRDAGIAEVGGELLDRDIGIGRQFFDRGRNAGALAPGLEAQLRLRRKQPRQRPRRGADGSRQRLDLMRAGGIAEHDVGGAPAARLVWQRDEGPGILGPGHRPPAHFYERLASFPPPSPT